MTRDTIIRRAQPRENQFPRITPPTQQGDSMILIAIAVAVGLALCFLLIRFMGSMGQKPSARERAKHNAGNPRTENPRASGLN